MREPGDAAAGSVKPGLSPQSWTKGEWVCARPPPRVAVPGARGAAPSTPGPGGGGRSGAAVRAVGAGGSWLCVRL